MNNNTKSKIIAKRKLNKSKRVQARNAMGQLAWDRLPAAERDRISR